MLALLTFAAQKKIANKSYHSSMTLTFGEQGKGSLQRALDRRLYLLLYGNTDGSAGKSVCIFQKKVYQSEETLRKQFFFKSQVIATNKFNIKKCEDFVWVTKDELLEYFPEKAEFLNKMIIS
ncbi:hypothetical protein Prudu_007216 [Prunus dulcis]|uniref:Uncharacterized protein n=1 Tax=Prunus dulcis TaxID=3755 RepID=A0A4Y1R1H4_PRUDU|nr:hypothetical protein Prudu_007216 [Prunus dulcis]